MYSYNGNLAGFWTQAFLESDLNCNDTILSPETTLGKRGENSGKHVWYIAVCCI